MSSTRWTVLIADPLPAARQELARLLVEEVGDRFDVHEARSVEAAARALADEESCAATCLLFGWNVPLPEVLDALGAFHAGTYGDRRFPGVVVVVTSAAVESRTALFRAGAHEVVTPESIRASSVTHAIENAMARRTVRHEEAAGHVLAHAREELLTLALGVGGAGAWAWNVDAGEIVGSPGLYGLLGGSSSGSGVPDVFRELLDMRERGVDTGRPLSRDVRVAEPGGGNRWLTVTGEMIGPAEGPRILGGMVFDITERVEAEERLSISERFNREILENSSDCVKVLDATGKLQYMNAAGLNLMEVGDPASIIGMDWSELWPERARKSVREAIRLALNGAPGRFQEHCPTASGNERWWDVAITPVRDEKGGISRLLSVSRDITEMREKELALRENQERLALALSASAMGVWSWDVVTQDVYWSPECHQLMRTDEQSLTAMTFDRLLHPDDRERVWATVSQALDTRSRYDAEFRVVCGDGVTRWMANVGRGDYDEQGRPVRMLGIVQDITRRKQLEEEREELLAVERQLHAAANAANSAKDQFLALLSHELRTPMTTILGWAGLVKAAQAESEVVARGLDQIEQASRSQARLIDDLLDVSRIVTGKLSLETEPLDVGAVLRRAVEVIQPSADAKAIEVAMHFGHEPRPVMGDPIRLQQIFWNLLVNALKFTPAGGHVDIGLEAAGDLVEISIRDDGQGIEPGFLPVLFDRFSQAGAGITTRQSKGLGLGLSIARHIAELHGGTIRARSSGPGTGSEFVVRLPLLDSAGVAVPAGVPSELGPDALEGIRVLIVEDDHSAREVLTNMVARFGGLVTATSCVADALQMIEIAPPHVVMSDIGMPDGDGYDMIRRIRSSPSSTIATLPALALTAYASTTDRDKAVAAGFQMYLFKPVDASVLARELLDLAHPQA